MNKRRTNTKEFKLEALRLLRESGKGATQLERELGIGKTALNRWWRECAEKGEGAFTGQGQLPPEKKTLRELERENEILR